MAAFVSEWTATDLGINLIRDAMLYILVGSAVMIVINLVGLVLACLPASRVRGMLMALYLCAGLPSFVFLVFVSVSAIALRDSAEDLVTTYWDCLKDLSSTKATQIPHEFQEIHTAAACSLAATVLLLVGLLCACRVVGWRHLARHTVVIVSLFSALAGAATLAVGIVLKATSKVEDVFFDGSVMGLGGSTWLISLVGIAGARYESKCMLRTYTFMLFALLCAIFTVAVYLVAHGTDALSAWFDERWGAMATHVCESALSPSCASSTDEYGTFNSTDFSSPVISRQEVEALAASHLLSITTLIILLFLTLLFDLMMACMLQYLVAVHGKVDVSEMEMLAPPEEDDDDDETDYDGINSGRGYADYD